MEHSKELWRLTTARMSLTNPLLILKCYPPKKHPNLRAVIISLPKVWMLARLLHQLPKHLDGVEQPDLRAAVMSLPEVLLPQVLRRSHQGIPNEV